MQVDDQLSNWCSKFASTAVTHLGKMFDNLDLTTAERAQYVVYLLGDHEKNRPYYYLTAVEGQPFAVGMPVIFFSGR